MATLPVITYEVRRGMVDDPDAPVIATYRTERAAEDLQRLMMGHETEGSAVPGGPLVIVAVKGTEEVGDLRVKDVLAKGIDVDLDTLLKPTEVVPAEEEIII